MASTRTVPIHLRLVRIVRLVVHIFRGLYLFHTRFPKYTKRQKVETVRRWARQLLGILHVRATCVDEPDEWPTRCMLITNHVSWMDVFAILSVVPCVFVAKSEIRGWPVVGRLVTLAGTLYIERGKHRHVQRINHEVARALVDGRVVGLCPEGTTTDGDRLLKFHTALFQPAIDAKAMLQPAAIRYLDAHGERTKAASYVGSHSLVRIGLANRERATTHRRIALRAANRRERMRST